MNIFIDFSKEKKSCFKIILSTCNHKCRLSADVKGILSKDEAPQEHADQSEVGKLEQKVNKTAENAIRSLWSCSVVGE